MDEINLGLSFSFLSSQLCDFGQVSHPLGTSFSPSINGDNHITDFGSTECKSLA